MFYWRKLEFNFDENSMSCKTRLVGTQLCYSTICTVSFNAKYLICTNQRKNGTMGWDWSYHNENRIRHEINCQNVSRFCTLWV